jgi:hypothetical protein
MAGRRRGGEVIIEFYYVGNAVKVSAIDPVTLTEVSIVGSPEIGEEELKRTAIRKLEYVLAKKDVSSDDGTLV